MFSIIIPTYNRGYCLEQTIRSVLDQTFSQFEVIVVDDGSSDNTFDIVNNLSKKDLRLRYIVQPNAGASSARNTGIELAQYNYVVFLDSDDTFEPTLLAVMKQALNNKNGLFGTVNHIRHIVLLNETGAIIDEHEPYIVTEQHVTLQDYYHWNIKTTSSGLFFDTNVFPDVKWDTKLRYIEDLDILMQLGEQDPDKFLFVPEPLIFYTQSYGGDGMCSNAKYQDWANAFDYIYHKHVHDPLMTGQTWWPDRVEKYTRLQQEVELGIHKPQMYKYFPQAIV